MESRQSHQVCSCIVADDKRCTDGPKFQVCYVGTRDLEGHTGYRVVAEDERIWRYLNEVLVIRYGERFGKALPQPSKTAASATAVVNRTVSLSLGTHLPQNSCQLVPDFQKEGDFLTEVKLYVLAKQPQYCTDAIPSVVQTRALEQVTAWGRILQPCQLSRFCTSALGRMFTVTQWPVLLFYFI